MSPTRRLIRASVAPRSVRWRSAILLAIAGAVAAEDTEGIVYKRLTLQDLMDIEVMSVSREEEPLLQAASSIQVVTGEDIERSGATTLAQALRQAPNLQVAQIDSRAWAVSARGFNSSTSNKLLVMVDGRTIYTPLFAGVFWDQQGVFLPDVDRIEVISGPGATLWGANAVNGVINVISKDAADTQGLLVEGAAGNELEALGGARYGGKIGEDVAYRVYGRYRQFDDSVLPDGSGADDDWRFGQGGTRIDWRPAPATDLTLQGDAYGGDIEQRDTNDDVTIAGGDALARWTQRLADDSDLQLQAYYDRTHRRIPNLFVQDLDTYDLDFQHRFPIGDRNAVIWGLGYRLMDDNIGNSAALAFVPANTQRDLISAFAQDEIAVVPELVDLTIGSKFERNDYTGWEVQPSVRLAWRPHDEHTVWGGVSRAVRTPSRIDTEFYLPGAAPFVIAGGPDFESEVLWAYEVGYRLQPMEWLSLSLTVFYHDYDDIRSLEPAAPPAATPQIIGNGLTARSYGAELSADCRATEWLRLRGGYTELRLDFDRQAGSAATGDGTSEARDSEHLLTAGTQVDLAARWQFDVWYRYIGRIESQEVPEYHEANARIGWLPWPELELSLVGQNLLHDQHAEFGAPATRREIERSVYGKFQWRF
ncbi:MAG TPA: TonB-dependent receptor [Planctomycetota bacterium]|nr:TonB-dependent receptor [Planctomycetota bacterium]